jgi:MGT family glycosyltransferase
VATIAVMLFPELGHVRGALGLAKALRTAGHSVTCIGATAGALHEAIVREGFPSQPGSIDAELVLVDANLAVAPSLRTRRTAYFHTALPNVRVPGRAPVSESEIGGHSLVARAKASLAWFGSAHRVPPSERSPTAHPALVLAPRELDPVADTLPSRFLWVGSCVDATRQEAAPEPAVAELLARAGPLVYCAFGSQGHRMRGRERMIHAMLGAASRLAAWRFVIATGGHVERAQLGHVPPNARVVDHAPQLAVLAQANVMVTHAGLNSVKECIAAGVPMLAIPLDHDQPGNATRIARLGLGRALAPLAASEDAIAAAVAELLYEPAYAARVVAFRARTVHYAGAPAAAIAQLLARAAA